MRTLAHAVDEDPETLCSRKAAVVLAQVLYELASETMGLNLLDWLLRYAVKLAEHGKVEDAIDIGKDALQHAHIMFPQNESKYRDPLANLPIYSTTLPILSMQGIPRCACRTRKNVWRITEFYMRGNPCRNNLAFSLCLHVGALTTLHRQDKALLACEEGIELAQGALAVRWRCI